MQRRRDIKLGTVLQVAKMVKGGGRIRDTFRPGQSSAPGRHFRVFLPHQTRESSTIMAARKSHGIMRGSSEPQCQCGCGRRRRLCRRETCSRDILKGALAWSRYETETTMDKRPFDAKPSLRCENIHRRLKQLTKCACTQFANAIQ